MKISKFLFVIVLAFAVANSKYITNNSFLYNFHCSNNSLCKSLKKELSSAVNSISSLMEFIPVIQFEAVVDDISKYRQDIKKETLAVALNKEFVPLNVNSNIQSPYPNSEKIMNEITTDLENDDFILIINNFESDKEGKKSSNLDYQNNIMKVIIDSLSSLKRLKDPYIKSSSYRGYDNSDIVNIISKRFNETFLTESFIKNEEKIEKKKLNKLSTIFHWKDRLISKGNPIKTSKSSYKRIVALGDIHGDYDKLVKVLRHAKLINRSNKWIAHDTVLIQLGDLFDFTNDVRKILDLLFKLKDQAKSKKSAVYFLYGNHEIFNLRYSYGLVTYADIQSFNGLENREELLSINGKYGKFIRKEMNIAMVLNDSLFVHTVLYPEIAEIGINNINKRAHDILINAPNYEELYNIGLRNETHPLYTDPILSDYGPLFNKIFDQEDESTFCPKIEKTLQMTNTKRMVVGHNVQEYGEIRTKCDNKLISIDVGMSSYHGNYFGYLEFLNNKNEIWAVYDN